MPARRRWRQVHYLADVFWRRWAKKQKWVDPQWNIEIANMVLAMNVNLPRNSRQLAEVLHNIPEKEGYVRSLEIKTKSGTLVRPITKMCLILEAEGIWL